MLSDKEIAQIIENRNGMPVERDDILHDFLQLRLDILSLLADREELLKTIENLESIVEGYRGQKEGREWI